MSSIRECINDFVVPILCRNLTKTIDSEAERIRRLKEGFAKLPKDQPPADLPPYPDDERDTVVIIRRRP